MINNFNLFKGFMNFRNDDEFYFLQIYKRKKDNGSMKTDNKNIRDYHIYSIEDLEKHQQSIIDTCHLHNARAYVRPNKRSAIYTALDAISIITRQLKDGRARDAYGAYQKAAGLNYVTGEKYWIVDIDDKDPYLLESVKASINKLYNDAGNKREIALELPTVNGWHLIAPPFNSKEFSNMYPDVVLQKENPTLIYFNGNG